jgi:small-conductance mechanosensitive channel
VSITPPIFNSFPIRGNAIFIDEPIKGVIKEDIHAIIKIEILSFIFNLKKLYNFITFNYKMAKIITFLSIIFGSFLLGFLFEKIILSGLRKIAERTKWEGDEIILKCLQKWILFWFILIGFHISLFILNLKPNIFNIVHKFFISIYIISITIVIANISGEFLNLYSKKTKEVLPSVSILNNIVKISIIIIGLLILLNSLGISITPILTALGIGGLAVALALQDTLSNLFAGFHIIVSRQIKPGNYIKLSTGEEGYVVDINWRNTLIKELSNNMIIIPNSKLASAIVTNYSLPENEIFIYIDVRISYDEDLEKVEKITIQVAKEVMKEVKGGDPEFEPFIRYKEFGEYSINLIVVLKAKEFVNQYLLKHEFIKRLSKKYKEEGIKFPYPKREIYIEKEFE